MKLPNGYGSVVKLSGKRRKPWMVRKTTGYRIDPVKEKKVNEYIIIGYAATKTEGLQMLADYNRNPYNTKAAKMTFDEVYEEWSKKKFPTVSESKYLNYYNIYCTPLGEQIGIIRTLHCTRHTCISMLSEAGVQDTTIKKIVGHSGAMTLTEKVYTHLDMQVLVDAINKILENEDSVIADTKSA